MTEESYNEVLPVRRMNRRKALSTMGAVGIGVGIIVVGGVAYYAGTATAPAPAASTVTKTETIGEKTVTQTVTQTTTVSPTTVTTTVPTTTTITTPTTVTTPTTPAGPVTITTAMLTGPRHGDAMKAMAAEYKKMKPNVTVNVDIMGNVVLYEKTTLELRQGTGAWDVIEGQPQYIPSYVASDWLVDQTPFIKDPSRGIPDLETDWPATVRNMYKYDDKYVAIPHDCNANIYYYRKDIFEQLGLQPARNLDELWDMLENKDFHNPPDRYGIAGSMGLYWTSDQFLGWYARTCVDKPYPYIWDPDTFEVTVNDENGLEALKIMHRLLEYMPPAADTWGEDDVYVSMGAVGNVMSAPYEWGGTTLFDPRHSQLYDKIDATVVPAGRSGEPRPNMGGFGLIIPKASKNVDAAWDWIQFVTSRENMRLYVQNGGQPARLSALNDSENVKLRPHFPALGKSVEIAYVWPLVPEFFAIVYGAIAEEINSAVTGVKSDQDALDALQKEITRQFQESGRLK